MPFSECAVRTIWLVLMMLALAAQGAMRAVAQTDGPSDAGSVLAVTVVDGVSEQGIAGAKLQIVAEVGRPHLVGNWTTDKAGCGTLKFPAGRADEMRFWTVAQGYVSAETSVRPDLHGEFPKVCTVRLERAVAVGGIDLNEAGEPVPGVEVFIDFGKKSETQDPSAQPGTRDNFHYEKTDAKGRWSCGHAPKQLQTVEFRLIHPDYVTAVLAPNTAERPEENVTSVSEADLRNSAAVVIMKRGLTVNGLVLDPSQKPIEGAEVVGADYPVWTAADGRFHFNNCAPGKLMLTAQAKGFARQQRQFWVSSRMDAVQFQLEKGKFLQLRVQDAKGRAISGARVSAEIGGKESKDHWQLQTDEQGKLVWDSAPAEDLLYSISHFGYEAVQRQPLPADGQEHVITLHRHFQISGHVRDFETQAPIASFRVVPGVLHMDHHDWNLALMTKGQNGTYAIALPKRDLPHVVRVEADGYYSEISPTFMDSEEEAVADFALNHGEPIRGVVHLPNGKPAQKAQAALCTEETTPVLSEAKFAPAHLDELSETDAQGSFLFQPQRGVKKIAVAHEQGYAEVSLADLQRSTLIPLKPWGRISGVLYVGTARATNALVQLIRIGSFSPQFQVNSFTALTDSQGHFTFEHVPPGEQIIGHLIESRLSHQRAITVAAGETTEVLLGGGGRTITGRMVVGDGRELDWEVGQPAFLHAHLPPLTVPKLPDGLATNAWLRAYCDSEQGRARQVSDDLYVLQFASNNLFHAENVPAGVYECEIHYHEPSARAGEPDTCLGILRKEVVIPEPPPGRPDEPYDLGKMTITLKPSAR